MKIDLVFTVFTVLICHSKLMDGHSVSYLGKSKMAEQLNSCKDGVEYPHNNICCLNCPAGTYLTSPCTNAHQFGTCEECDFETYTEHPNNLPQCFKCMRCRSDEEEVRSCSHMHNTKCQCKSGWFCHPDEPCEVCKKCSRCENDEVTVRNCTSTTNTECKKMEPISEPDNTAVIVTVLGLALAAVLVIYFVYKRYSRARDSHGHPHDKTVAPLVSSSTCSEDCRMLYESRDSSASNSQHSLTNLHCSAQPSFDQQAISTLSVESTRREHEPFPTLVPVNGEESLRRCFDFFTDVDIDQYKRFFRHLDLSDNVIKSKEILPYEERIHELLNIWVEKEGRRANFNDLLKTLLHLNQRKTAEDIKNAAINHGHYSSDC